MNNKIILILMLFLQTCLLALKPSFPSENIKRLQDSPIFYDFKYGTDSTRIGLEKPILSYNISAVHYNFPDSDTLNPLFKAKQSFEIAEGYVLMNDFKNAVTYYDRAFKLDNSNYDLLISQGECYFKLNESKKGIALLKKYYKQCEGIYLYHWVLSKLYIGAGKEKKALDEIIKAHILNRNEQQIQAILDFCLMRLNLQSDMTRVYFENNIFMDKDTVQVYLYNYSKADSVMNTLTLVYSACKALWMSDSVFVSEREIKTSDLGNFMASMEIDAYNNMMIMSLSKPSLSHPMGEYYYRVLKANMRLPFVLYEKILVDDPLFSAYVDSETLNQIFEYYRKFRIKKK